jgi:hypothetical protein
MDIFGIFSRMLGKLPAPAIIKALDAECQMLEDDFQHYRLNAFNATEDALSILSFRGFIQMMKSDTILQCSRHLPFDHLEFYKETLRRLIQAGELPSSAMKEFESVFTV